MMPVGSKVYSRTVAVFFMFAVSGAAFSDVIQYQLPGSSAVITLQGSVQFASGQTAAYKHPKFGTLKLDATSLNITKVLPIERRYKKRIRAATSEGGPDEVMKVADWCLGNGYMEGFYDSVDRCLELDPGNRRATTIKKLRAVMKKPLPDSPKVEAYMRKHVKKSGMKVLKSKHYILLHDTPDTKIRGKTRAEERIELLERVYESFMFKFFSQGVKLKIPKYRLMVVLFHDREDFLAFSGKLGPDMASVAGFWHTLTNLAVFFDQAESDRFKEIREVEKKFQQAKADAIKRRGPSSRMIIQTADALQLILQMAREDADIEVVSHEATHQLAGNTGLFPRHVKVPSWIHEGLATYFESPEDATWGGIGAVNEDRLRWYRALSGDKEHSNVRFIVGDQIFKYAGDLSSTLHGYGQAWALTHFLVERHFDEYMAFCRRLGEMPPDVILSPDVLTKLFEEVSDSDLEGLNAEWHTYMKSLKTDIDRILNDEDI